MNPIEWTVNRILGFIFRVIPQPKPAPDKIKEAKLVAHRGVHESRVAPENSLISFDLAVKNNIWAIEFDVHMTKDHVAIINHDPHCRRLFNRPDLIIADCTYKQLKSEVSLPTLAEVVEKFGRKIHLMIEIKEDLRGSPEKIAALIKILQPLTPDQDYHLLSLTPSYLEAFKAMDPKVLLDVIWLDSKSTFHENDILNHGAIAGHFLFFKKSKIAALKQQNKKIGMGFIDSKNSLYRELNRGADYIFTNHPLRLKNFLKKASVPQSEKSLDAHTRRG